MKLVIAFAAAIAALTDAAPAIVWTKNGADRPAEHHSSNVHISSIISSAIGSASERGEQQQQQRRLNNSPSLESVVFLVGRDDDGAEAMSRLAGAGELPSVSERYGSADAVHHHVGGVESSRTVARDASKAGGKTMQVTLDELNRRLAMDAATEETTADAAAAAASKKVKTKRKRDRELREATVLVVNAPPAMSKALDEAVIATLENDFVRSVVLTAVRSTEEVKQERSLMAMKRQSIMKSNAKQQEEQKRRRLEDAQQADDGNWNNNNANNDLEGIYYVSITPNILAGVLFLFMFVFVTYTGIMCMGMIKGQDVYTNKYPTIGREA